MINLEGFMYLLPCVRVCTRVYMCLYIYFHWLHCYPVIRSWLNAEKNANKIRKIPLALTNDPSKVEKKSFTTFATSAIFFCCWGEGSGGWGGGGWWVS